MPNTNPNRPFGFRPWRFLNGNPWNGAVNLYFILANDTNVYSPGDIVKSVAESTGAGLYDINGVPAVTKAVAGDTPRGVVVACSQTYPGATSSLQGNSLALEQTWLSATKPANGAYVWVCDDPNVIFKAQMNNATIGGGGTIASSLSKNCNYAVTPGTFVSGTVLNASTVATTATLPVRLLGLVNGAENVGITDLTSTTGDFAVFQCMFNVHELGRTTGGAGV